eukprot:TRINITY_DN29496_c0_g2_i1.p1 TRINITY_DN29496_c0_g2~~TRINITY_DN29496_c0_g2_i1.p1  ORF type:complete len:1106 (-),score=291.54 TRINITY_DN29496_c0_g2_i1:789-4106(-)
MQVQWPTTAPPLATEATLLPAAGAAVLIDSSSPWSAGLGSPTSSPPRSPISAASPRSLLTSAGPGSLAKLAYGVGAKLGLEVLVHCFCELGWQLLRWLQGTGAGALLRIQMVEILLAHAEKAVRAHQDVEKYKAKLSKELDRLRNESRLPQAVEDDEPLEEEGAQGRQLELAFYWSKLAAQERMAWADERRAWTIERTRLLQALEQCRSRVGNLQKGRTQHLPASDGLQQQSGGGFAAGSVVEWYRKALGGWILARIEAAHPDGSYDLDRKKNVAASALRSAVELSTDLLDLKPQAGCLSGRHYVATLGPSGSGYWLRRPAGPVAAILYVDMPNVAGALKGMFELRTGQISEGLPVWRQLDGSLWLYSSVDGKWLVGPRRNETGVEDVPEDVVAKSVEHDGRLPEALGPAEWERGGAAAGRVNDKESPVTPIAVTHVLVLDALDVPSLKEEECSGTYVRAMGESIGKFPVWKQRNGSFWMYSDKEGRWAVAAAKKEEDFLENAKAVITSRAAHGLKMPDALGTADWRRRLTEEQKKKQGVDKRQKGGQGGAGPVGGGDGAAGEAKKAAAQAKQQAAKDKKAKTDPKDGPPAAPPGKSDGDWVVDNAIVVSHVEHEGQQRRFQAVMERLSSEIGSLSAERVAVESERAEIAAQKAVREQLAQLRQSVEGGVHAVVIVEAPNAEEPCSGEYELSDSLMVSALPAWKLRGKGCWLFSGGNGQWFVGDEQDLELASRGKGDGGFLASRYQHHGKMPYDLKRGSWQRLAAGGAAWQPDDTLVITSPETELGKAQEEKLQLSKSTELLQSQLDEYINGSLDKPPPTLLLDLGAAESDMEQPCGGPYDLVDPATETAEEGFPLWRQRHGYHWFFSCAGRWFVGGEFEREDHFKVERGYLASKAEHDGRTPDKMALSGGWLRLKDREWIEGGGDMAVTVGQSAEDQLRHENRRLALALSTLRSMQLSGEAAGRIKLLKLEASGLQEVQGIYEAVVGQMPNGCPLWKQLSGPHWLFSGLAGQWLVGSEGEAELAFHTSNGVLASVDAHEGRSPDRIDAGGWQRLIDDCWEADAEIRFTAIESEPCLLSGTPGLCQGHDKRPGFTAKLPPFWACA